MRKLLTAAALAAITTFVVAISLRAPDATLAVVAIAAITLFVTWLSIQHSTEQDSGLVLANPASTLALTLIGRSGPEIVLPLIAGHLVGGVVGGLAALGLDRWLDDPLVWPTPGLGATAVVVFVLGVVATWLLFAIDAHVSELYAAVPPLLAGAALPLSLSAALNPAVVVGLATAGLLPWDVAGVAAASAFAASVAGTYTIGLISPRE